MENKHARWLLLAMLAILLLPWLGQTVFNTKGEPREAIVAVSMLQSGNWILPVSYGADIPYKPPFLAWLIAIFSLIFNGGEVNAYLSRLPSALAAIAMVMGGYRWASRRGVQDVAMLMAVVTITSFEVFRAAVACRVDMVLTACMCLALYQMYEWRHRRGLQPWRLVGISLLLSGAALTKGPVGTLLPCLAMGIFCLLRGDNFWRSLGWLSCVCVMSMVLPALWYWQAYCIGGSGFLDLAYEENIGRLTGSMGYDSHLNPWPYNVLTILTGLLPWTLAVIFIALAWIASKPWRVAAWPSAKAAPATAWRRLKAQPDASAFALTVSLVIFLFYCIPASKRSVYLLPMYPFMAYGIGRLLLAFDASRAMAVFNRLIITLCLIVPFLAICLQFTAFDKVPIQPMPWWRYPLALMPFFVGLYWLRRDKVSHALSCSASVLALYFCYASALMPMVLNAKTDMEAVRRVREISASETVYSKIGYDSLIRYYTLNFYAGDRLRMLEPDIKGPITVLAPPEDLPTVQAMYPKSTIEADTLVRRSVDTRRPTLLLRLTPMEDVQ